MYMSPGLRRDALLRDAVPAEHRRPGQRRARRHGAIISIIITTTITMITTITITIITIIMITIIITMIVTMIVIITNSL